MNNNLTDKKDQSYNKNNRFIKSFSFINESFWEIKESILLYKTDYISCLNCIETQILTWVLFL